MTKTSTTILIQENGAPVEIKCRDSREVNMLLTTINIYGWRWKKRLGLKSAAFTAQRISDRIISIRASGVTGFIRIKNIFLEIKPKFLQNVENENWKPALMQMLILINPKSAVDQNYTVARSSQYFFADLIADRFLVSLSEGILGGLPRIYMEQSDFLTCLRGRLNTSKIFEGIIKNLIPCDYDDYNSDSIVNQLLRWTALELARVVQSSRLAEELHAVANSMEDITHRIPSISEAENIKLSPQYAHLEEAVFLAKLFLRSQSLEHGSGNSSLKGFLWNTAMVFEKLVKVIVKRVCKMHSGLSFTDAPLSLGRGMIHAKSILKTSPDVRILENGRTKIILDAKYKNWIRQPKSSDIYQVMAGGRVTCCAYVGLIYPIENDIGHNPIWLLNADGNPRYLTSFFINLNEMADPGGLENLVVKLNQDINCFFEETLLI